MLRRMEGKLSYIEWRRAMWTSSSCWPSLYRLMFVCAAHCCWWWNGRVMFIHLPAFPFYICTLIKHEKEGRQEREKECGRPWCICFCRRRKKRRRRWRRRLRRKKREREKFVCFFCRGLVYIYDGCTDISRVFFFIWQVVLRRRFFFSLPELHCNAYLFSYGLTSHF